MSVRLFVLRALLLPGLLSGCDGGPAPAQKAVPVDAGPTAEELPPVAEPKPDRSEPAAALAVNAILMAHTDNEPARIERLRKVQIRRKGTFRLPDGQSNATMEIQMWGDQYRAKMALEVNGNFPNVYWVSGDRGWHLQPMQTQRAPLSLVETENVFPDVRGDQMSVLVPLASEKLIAAVARPATGDRGAILRLWVGDQPPILLQDDPATHRVVRLIYGAMDAGRPVERTLRLGDYKPVAGVLLPHAVTFGIGERSLTTWDKIEYEVPGQFELSIFDGP